MSNTTTSPWVYDQSEKVWRIRVGSWHGWVGKSLMWQGEYAGGYWQEGSGHVTATSNYRFLDEAMSDIENSIKRRGTLRTTPTPE